jgi:hypothetical protein
MASESISAYQPAAPGGPGFYPQQPMGQMQQPMQAQQMQQMNPPVYSNQPQQMGEVADMLNNQLGQQVDPNLYVDPSMMQPQMMPVQENKFPEFLKDPALVFLIVAVLSQPVVRNNLGKYIPQISDKGGVTITSTLILAALVALTYALVKKFIMKN